MASFKDNALTVAGQLLLAEVQLGGVFEATRIVLGSGLMPTGMTAENMLNVVSPEVSLSINKKVRSDDGRVILGAYFSNKEAKQAFYWRELGVYARARWTNEDGSFRYSDEVLYSYGNAGARSDHIPTYGENSVVERQIDVITWIGNQTQINLTITGGVWVTHAEMNRAIADCEGRLNSLIYDVEVRTNRNIISLGDRLDGAIAVINEHTSEIASLKAYDIEVHSRLNEVAAQTTAVWDAIFNDITENPAVVDFDTLDGFALTGGVWNYPLRRLEV